MPTFIVYVDWKRADELGIDLNSFAGPNDMAKRLAGVDYHAFLWSERDDPKVDEFARDPKYRNIQVDGN